MVDSEKRFTITQIYNAELNTQYNEAGIFVPSVSDVESMIGGSITKEWVDNAYVEFINQYNQIQDEETKRRADVSYSFIISIAVVVISLITGFVSAAANLSLLTVISWFAFFGSCLFAGLKMCFAPSIYARITNECMQKKKSLCEELYSVSLVYFVKKFGETSTQIQHDILKVSRERNWWIKYELVQVMERELERRYKFESNSLRKSDLQVENLQLQNEGIAIDNVQKKFWRCASCGNLNRADDMNCPSCGAIRQMEG